MESSEAWTIPKAIKNVKCEDMKSPGPANYKMVNLEVNHEKFPEWTIKGRYPNKTQLHDGPGPGNYKDGYDDSRNLKYSIRHRTGNTIKNENPGPGAYNPKLTKGGDGISMAKKYQPSKSNQTPGPGNYNTYSSIDPN